MVSQKRLNRGSPNLAHDDLEAHWSGTDLDSRGQGQGCTVVCECGMPIQSPHFVDIHQMTWLYAADHAPWFLQDFITKHCGGWHGYSQLRAVSCLLSSFHGDFTAVVNEADALHSVSLSVYVYDDDDKILSIPLKILHCSLHWFYAFNKMPWFFMLQKLQKFEKILTSISKLKNGLLLWHRMFYVDLCALFVSFNHVKCNMHCICSVINCLCDL